MSSRKNEAITGRYASLEDLIAEVAEVIRPPERLTVSQAAEKYRYLNNAGSYVGPWMNDTTPYLTEVMDCLASRDFTGVIFAGPAQTGKTDMFLNWLTYTVKCDPADMMLIQTSQAIARDFTKRRIDRLHRHTKVVGERVVPRRDADNIYNKLYKSGMMLTMSWPTINELSGRPVPRLWLTDYDRMDEDIDGEGSPYDLAKKRATSFRRNGMCAAESSPGYVQETNNWMPGTPHEAPPTRGILALYNRGDRRRWYWKCPDCAEWFEPDFHLLVWPDTGDVLEEADKAAMACPQCGSVHLPTAKYDMNRKGRWVKDGQRLTADDELLGTPVRSDIASFWMKGVAAAFADWRTLVFNFLKAEQEYESTGSEKALQTTVNIDQGLPYLPKNRQSDRHPEQLKARAEDYQLGTVPEGVRFLIGAIDVQGNRFEVQIHGVGEGGDKWIVDRFAIRKSNRLDEDGDRLPINPGAYLEDWDLITEQVLQRRYPLADDSGRMMSVKMTACDSGGRAGVTTNAYAYYRRLKDTEEKLNTRFLLVKGASHKSAPRQQLSYPDSERKDRSAGARGEIPVLLINGNLIKDQVDKNLDCLDAGKGRIHFSKGLPDWFYSELVAETKTHKGWENLKKVRNEAFDLITYCDAVCLTRWVRLEHIDWQAPPGWAERWDDNDLVTKAEVAPAFTPRKKVDLAALAAQLA